jgi:hypothetical protein
MLVGAMMFMANALRLRDRFGDKLPVPPSSQLDLETLSEAVLDIVLDGISRKGN